VAYGEKNLTFQGPLPEKIQLFAHKGLLSLTYSQQIQVQRRDNKIFEVRRIAGKKRNSSCGGSQSLPTEALLCHYNMRVRQVSGWLEQEG
jgi:hypothetical protein